MTEAAIDALTEGGLTEAQAHAVCRLRADVQCRRAFDREVARQDLVGAGFSSEQADWFIDRTLSTLGRSDQPSAEVPAS